MAFKIVDEEYHMEKQGRNPEVMGYVEGYTSNTVGKTFLRLNCFSVPDEEMYECYRRSGCLESFEFRPGKRYGEGVRLNRRQVVKLIFELAKWLVRGY